MRIHPTRSTLTSLRIALGVAATTLLLAACGGGGDGGDGGASAPPPVAPQITAAPASQTAVPGLAVTFRSGASGTAPLSYQWRRDGAAIAGATGANFTLTAALADEGARFSVVVSNAAGNAASGEALLSVNPAPAAAVSCASGAFTAHIDAGVAVGKAAGVALAGCATALSDPRWTQTAGPALDPALNLLSAKTQVISFEPPSPGRYEFSVTFRDGAGVAQVANAAVTAAAAGTGSRVIARVDQAVRKGGNVSLRAWPLLATGDAVAAYRFTQIDGPAVVMEVATIDTPSGRTGRALFRAPEVQRDTLLRFRVNLTTTGGVSDSDDVFVLVESAAQAPAVASSPYVFDGIHVSRVYPYREMGPFAQQLARCTYNPALQWTGGGKNLCSLQTLPFLHQTTGGAVPTTEQIMQRVLVSHDWMGAEFERFLNTPAATTDLKRMFNGVTAIVLGAHVRPSYYYALSGAIYLDADNFWVSAAQRDVVNEAPDFRIGFDRDLSYSGLWRYVLNNGNIFQLCNVTGRSGRAQDCLLYDAGWLLYHELGHAADFMPPAEQPGVNPVLSAWDNIAPRYNGRQLPSDLLDGTHPLSSAQMRALAQVKFFGATADAVQRSYTPQQVADFFRVDGASDEYNYATTREDITMLVEEFFMVRNHAIRRDVAITDKITPTTTGDTLLVRWGQRGRVGEAAVRQRVQFSLQRLAPWVLAADANAVNNLPPPIPMRAGESWNANVVLPGPPLARAALQRSPGAGELETDRALLQRAARSPHARAVTERGLTVPPSDTR